MDSESKVLNVNEASEFLKISRAMLYRLIKDGQIKTIKIGDLTKIAIEELERFINAQSQQPAIKVKGVWSRSNLEDALLAVQRATDEKVGLVIIDLSEAVFVTPTGLAMLCSIIDRTTWRGGNVRIKDPQNEEFKVFLKSIGFWDYLHIATSPDIPKNIEPNVQLKRLQNLDIALTGKLVEFIESSISVSPGVSYVLSMAHNELIENAMVHSQSRRGCLVCAQSTPKSKLLRLTVLDEGQGIRSSLMESYPKIENDIAAIKLAVQEGVGARKTEDRGLGLHEILKFVKVNDGELTIISGHGKVIFKREEVLEEKLKTNWSGTIVEVRLNQDKESFYRLSSEERTF
ncbi:MAG: helix-turn-helix domain-containing protein [Candidatus Omnitrophota bacterium]